MYLRIDLFPPNSLTFDFLFLINFDYSSILRSDSGSSQKILFHEILISTKSLFLEITFMSF